MRYITVRALWACADVLEIVHDGLIVLASKAVSRACTYTESSVPCAVCGDPLTSSELQRVRADTDFIDHGDRGHLIRISKAW